MTTETYKKAEAMLSEELRPLLAPMCEEYKFAALKIHGSRLYSPRVIAELILMGWRSL